LKNIENKVTGTRRQLSLAAERIANRLKRLELDVVGIGRQLGAFNVAIDSTVDRIESLKEEFSHMRRQLSITEESLEGLVSRFDNLEDEVVKIGYQLSNDVDKLAKTVENHPPERLSEKVSKFGAMCCAQQTGMHRMDGSNCLNCPICS
jgi:predicted  nucleic acid-binding Zn-ribbon protein